MSSNVGDENSKYFAFIEPVYYPQFQSHPTRFGLNEHLLNRFRVLRYSTLSAVWMLEASQGEALNLSRNTFCPRFPEGFLRYRRVAESPRSEGGSAQHFFTFLPRVHEFRGDPYECVVGQPNTRFQSLRETQKYARSKLSLGGDFLRKIGQGKPSICLIE